MLIMATTVTTANLTSNVNLTVNFTDYGMPSTPTYIVVCATVFYVMIFAFGVLGNLLVCLVVSQRRDMKNSTNYFLVNLSVADLLVLLVCSPSALIEIYSKEIWYLGKFMCKMVPYLENTVAAGSTLTIIAISLERYYAICCPLKAQYTCTRMRTIKIVLVIWVLSSALCVPFIVMTHYGDSVYVDGSTVKTCMTLIGQTWERIYFVALWCLCFPIPFIILIALYATISCTLVSDAALIGMKNDPSSESNYRSRRQVVLMLSAVVACFFTCLLPFRIVSLWLVFVSGETLMSLGLENYLNLMVFVRVMFFLNSAINPIVYNAMSTKFRKGFAGVLDCRCLLRSGKRNEMYYTSSRAWNFNSFRTSSMRSTAVSGSKQSPSRTSGHSCAMMNEHIQIETSGF